MTGFNWFSCCWFVVVFLVLFTSGTWYGVVLALVGLSVVLGHSALLYQGRAYFDLVDYATKEMRMTMLSRLAQSLHRRYEENIELQLSSTVGPQDPGDPFDAEVRGKLLRAERDSKESNRKARQERMDQQIQDAKRRFWRAVGVLQGEYGGFMKPKSYKDLLPPKEEAPADPD